LGTDLFFSRRCRSFSFVKSSNRCLRARGSFKMQYVPEKSPAFSSNCSGDDQDMRIRRRYYRLSAIFAVAIRCRTTSTSFPCHYIVRFLSQQQKQSGNLWDERVVTESFFITRMWRSAPGMSEPTRRSWTFSIVASLPSTESTTSPLLSFPLIKAGPPMRTLSICQAECTSTLNDPDR
jgi:hypothetical protein